MAARRNLEVTRHARVGPLTLKHGESQLRDRGEDETSRRRRVMMARRASRIFALRHDNDG
jgi:hypothetical protein